MSIKQPVYCEVDLTDPQPGRLLTVSHTDDTGTEFIELALKSGESDVDASGKTVTARFVVHGTPAMLISDNVSCTVNESGHILIPFDNAVLNAHSGEMDIEVSIDDNGDILTLPYPLWVRVRESVLSRAVVWERAQGLIPDLLARVRDELERIEGYTTPEEVFAILDGALSGDTAQYPALVIDNRNEQEEYRLYYVDSDDGRHELFNFSRYFAERATTLADYGISNAYTKAETDDVVAAKVYEAVEDIAERISEEVDYFQLETQTLGGVTVTNNGDGSYTFNGTSTGIVLFPAFTVPAGDYTAHIGAVSGTADAQGAIRYGTGSGELWISTNHTEESQSFDSPTPVFFRLNTGTYTNWRLRIRVEKDGYVSAVDGVARDGLEEVSERVSVLDVISERNNYFSLDTQTVSGISAAKLSEDTFEFSGTNSASAAFPEFYIPAGTYSAKIEAVSGTATARAGIRYGEGNGTSWVTDGTAQPVQLTFNARTRIFFRLNIGEYSAWRLKISITNAAAEYTAIDYKMREKSAEDDLRAAALAETVAGLEMPVNHLSAYNAFTCVDKTKVKLTAATNILAFGDSITHGGSWGTPWVTYLSNIVGCTVNNYAVSGALFGESVRTSDKWISSQISAVTAADWSAATLVIVAAGTNDAGYSTTDSELATKVQAAITAIKAQTNAPILFITPIKRGSTDADANYGKLPKISGIIENVALKNRCSVICGLDFPIPAHDSGVIENMMGEAGGYIHPNNTGGYVYAMCVINAVM